MHFAGHSPTAKGWGALNQGYRFCIENVREALAEPGQWYLDRTSGELIYFPRPGEQPEKCVVIAPRLPRLVSIAGDVPARRWVEHVQFRGLTLRPCQLDLAARGPEFSASRDQPGRGHLGRRRAEPRAGGLRGAARRRLCHGFRAGLPRQPRRELRDGRSGRRRREDRSHGRADGRPGGMGPGRTRGDRLPPHGPPVPDRPRRPAALRRPSACGSATRPTTSSSTTTSSISTTRAFRSAGSGATPAASAHHNDIGFNHVHTIGQAVLSDMGGIYTLGVSPGTARPRQLLPRHPVVQLRRLGPVHRRGLQRHRPGEQPRVSHQDRRLPPALRPRQPGAEQHLRLRRRSTRFSDPRQEPHTSFFFERNIVYWDNASPLLGSNWGDNHFKLDNNVYWNTSGKPVQFPGNLTLDAVAQKRGSGRAFAGGRSAAGGAREG